MKNKILFGLSLAVFGCAGAVSYMDTDQPPVHAPEKIKIEAFTSMPVLLDNGTIICEDGSMYQLMMIKGTDQILTIMTKPPMEAPDAPK